jgi:hypothetical protein
MQSLIRPIIAEKADRIGSSSSTTGIVVTESVPEMERVTSSVFQEFENDASVRLIVMRGACGKAFVSARTSLNLRINVITPAISVVLPTLHGSTSADGDVEASHCLR